MKKINKHSTQQTLQKILKIQVKILPYIIGVTLFGLLIYFTYQYLSTRTRADAPGVNIKKFGIGDCVIATSKTCNVNNEINNDISVNLDISANNNNKMSGIDFIIWFNGGNAGHLEFKSATSSAFTETLVAGTHSDPQSKGQYLHLALVADKNQSALPSTDTLQITFATKKTGESRIALITSALTIVGPNSDMPYQITPQNALKNSGSNNEYENIINIKVSTTDPATITPTSTVTPGVPTVTPGVPTVTPEVPTVTPGAGLQDISINFRFKIQGVTSQPKNSSPIEFEIALVENSKARPPFKLSMQPQADGTYVGDTKIKGVNISSDAHSFLIKGPKHLRKKICQNQPTETSPGVYKCNKPNIRFVPNANTVDFSSIYMLAGDLPVQNGIVDSVDLAYLRANAGSREVEALSRADLNFDNIVDTQDYALVINALGFKYDD